MSKFAADGFTVPNTICPSKSLEVHDLLVEFAPCSYRVQWYQICFGFSVCSHVYLLNYRSELNTDTIHDHNHTKKMQVRSAIMGRNGRVDLE